MSWNTSTDKIKQVLKNGTPKEIVSYLWYYFKWHFIILLLLIVMATDLIYTNVTAKEYVLQGMFLNVLAEQDISEKLENSYLSKHPIDFSSQDVFFDTSLFYSPDTDATSATNAYETLQLIVARIIGGQSDFIVADAKTLAMLAYEGYYSELANVLTEAQYIKYENHFLYYDRAYLEYLNTLSYDDTDISYPDPTKPELMVDPVPIMIDVSNSSILTDVYLGSNNTYGFAIIANGANLENSLKFIDHLMD